MNKFGYTTMVNDNVVPYNGGNMPQGNLVYIDLAAVMEAYSIGMMRAFEMGRQAALAGSASSDDMDDKGNFIGAYDAYAYGVYDNEENFSMSKRYWHNPTLAFRLFESYEEALNFAAAGVAGLKKSDPAMVQPMQYRINWRQIV